MGNVFSSCTRNVESGTDGNLHDFAVDAPMREDDQAMASDNTISIDNQRSNDQLPRKQVPIDAISRTQPQTASSNDELTIEKVVEVFKSCDADQAGNLGALEAKFALQAFGLYPSVDDTERVMQELQLSLPLNEQELLVLIRALNKRNCTRGLVAVPYARRGLSLRQLKKLAAGLLDTGWLQEICDKNNKENEDETEKGKKFRSTTNLYSIDTQFVRKTTRSGPNTRGGIPKEVLKIAGVPDSPHNNCCFAQLMNPEGLEVDYFISHWWGHDFWRTVQSLIKFAEKEHKNIGKESPEDVVFWICLFALNQHQAAEEVGETPEQGPFNVALAKSKHGVLMVLDEDAHPMSRIWCLFEVYRAKEFGKEFKLIVEDGDLTSASIDTLKKISDKLTKLRAVTAEASFEPDRKKILYRIMDPVHAGAYSSFESFNRSTWGTSETWYFKDFDSHMCSLISAPMFLAGMAAKSAYVCLQAIGMGANVTVADLKVLTERLGADLTAKVTTRFGRCGLVHAFARLGFLDNLSHVMDIGVEVDEKDDSGDTALHFAAEIGHVEICTMLLQDRGAEANSVTNAGYTALHLAANYGHAAVCKLLLDNGAEVNGETNYGSTALDWAAQYGHVAVCKLLLGRGAEVNHKNIKNGVTALYWAVEHGQEKVCRILLDSGAEVNHKDNNGRTVLYNSKSEEVSKLLLAYGATV